MGKGGRKNPQRKRPGQGRSQLAKDAQSQTQKDSQKELSADGVSKPKKRGDTDGVRASDKAEKAEGGQQSPATLQKEKPRSQRQRAGCIGKIVLGWKRTSTVAKGVYAVLGVLATFLAFLEVKPRPRITISDVIDADLMLYSVTVSNEGKLAIYNVQWDVSTKWMMWSNRNRESASKILTSEVISKLDPGDISSERMRLALTSEFANNTLLDGMIVVRLRYDAFGWGIGSTDRTERFESYYDGSGRIAWRPSRKSVTKLPEMR